MSKKSQIEIMGLLLIVIIITLALLFAVRVVFQNKGSTTDIYETYVDQKLVSSLVNAMFQTDSGCTKDTTIRDLLIDCAKAYSYGGTIKCENSQRSCDFVNAAIDVMLEGTLDEWRFNESYGYEFIATVPPSPMIVNISKGNFSDSMSGTTEPYKLPLYPSTKELYVYLCIGGCGFS